MKPHQLKKKPQRQKVVTFEKKKVIVQSNFESFRPNQQWTNENVNGPQQLKLPVNVSDRAFYEKHYKPKPEHGHHIVVTFGHPEQLNKDDIYILIELPNFKSVNIL